ncbi:MAG: prolyl oligopeptidase family serine peptidase [Balneolaceae bacterium]|jgi:dipeptidyl aminopeptidase/acylaminoacyl peptidase
MIIRRLLGLTALYFLITNNIWAQKKKLEPRDYGQWQSISTTRLSADGKWFAYNISQVNEKGWLTIKKVGPHSVIDHKFMHALHPVFSQDSKWAAFLIGVSRSKRKFLNKQKKEFHYKLGLMNLHTVQVDTFYNIRQFSFSNNGKYLVMQKYKPEGAKTKGTDLIIRNLERATNQLIGNVSEYAFDNSGNKLAVLLDASNKLGNGVHLYRLNSHKVTVLDSDTTCYTNLAWNKDGSMLAFLKAQKMEHTEDSTYQVYTFRNLNKSWDKQVFDQQHVANFPDSFRVVDYRNLSWSEDNKTLFFGIKKYASIGKPQEPIISKTDSLGEDLKPSNVEIWHWKDDDIQPKQEIMAKEQSQKNYLSAWHLDSNKFVQIGSKKFEEVQLTGDQHHAVGYDRTPYEPAFKEEWANIYIINVNTGKREKILTQMERVYTSPAGKYLLYFKDKNWWTYDIAHNKHINISKKIDTHFEDFTRVNGRKHRRPFGFGKWNKKDLWVLAYDQYDVYKLWADGSKQVKITSGAENKIRYRQVNLDNDSKGLSDDGTIYFSLYGKTTKNRGYASFENGETHPLIYEPQFINHLVQADSTQDYVYQVQTATDSPDYFHVGKLFRKPVQLTHTNPQQDDYYWAGDTLVTFTSDNGDRLEGRLLYPAHYEPGKKYPMITYIYEKRSQTLHRYSLPSRRSPYNFRRYSSEGYFVFQPDIIYKLGKPGISAVNCVVPAVKKIIGTGMVNKDQIGITGHSWGGYQTTFISTQTDIFHSAVAGAPLTNMISMYNSVYWNSGTTDARIFEINQGRFPDPWWQDWDNYLKNSPIFNLDHMETPLLVEFGTKDGAVDFNQGVELYNTMRRMQHPFVMLVYQGENHSLTRKENQIDYANRAFEWHEHYLRGKKAPEWIKQGLSFLNRPAITIKEEN